MYPLLSIREDSDTGRRRQRNGSTYQVDSVRKSLSKTITSPASPITPAPSSSSISSPPLLSRTQRTSTEPSSSRSWSYHIETIWLFTFSDLKTIVGPKTLFGLCHALCLNVFLANVSSTPSLQPLSLAALHTTAPRVLLWVWINLLPFAINNQRNPEAVLEDKINKPWRPMPSGRISFRAATRIMFTMYTAAFVASCFLGGLRQHLALIALGFWYNNLGGADVSCFTRNLINGLGFVCFGTGAMEVALGGAASSAMWTPTMVRWQLLIVALVTTSVHTQDMYDQEGDSLRGRWTVPLSAGDGLARWTIAVAVPFWSLVAAHFWAIPAAVAVLPALLALTVAVRTMTRRTVEMDKTTFRIWNLWVVSIYTLPLVKSLL